MKIKKLEVVTQGLLGDLAWNDPSILTLSDPGSTISPGCGQQPGRMSLCLYAEKTSSLQGKQHNLGIVYRRKKHNVDIFFV